MCVVDYPICRVKHIFYWICDTKKNISMTIQILYLPAFFSAEEEIAAFKELLTRESAEVSLDNIVVKPVSDIEESLIFELALLYADKTQDAFGPIKVSFTGIRYRVLHL